MESTTTTTTVPASPKKLRDGTWGAITKTAKVAKHDIVTITTRAGKMWDAEITKVVWTGNGAAIVATANLDRRPVAKPRRQSTGVRGQAASVAGYDGFCTGRASCGCFDCE